MNAEEAKRLTKENRTFKKELFENQLAFITGSIRSAVNNGKFNCIIEFRPLKETLDELEKRGFQVKALVSMYSWMPNLISRCFKPVYEVRWD